MDLRYLKIGPMGVGPHLPIDVSSAWRHPGVLLHVSADQAQSFFLLYASLHLCFLPEPPPAPTSGGDMVLDWKTVTSCKLKTL